MARIDEISVEEQPLEWDTPLFRTAVAQFEEALTHAEVDAAAAERLRYPEADMAAAGMADQIDWPGIR